MPAITIDGRSVSLDVRGSGAAAALFVHGVGPGSTVWDLVAQGLDDTRRALLLDLPGFGASEQGNFSGSVSDAATLVHHVLHAYGVTGALPVVGHGFGALVALDVAARFPSHVKGLALISTAGFEPNPAALLARSGAASNGWGESDADAWLRDGLVERLADEHLAAMRAQAAAPDGALVAACFASSARRVLLETAADVAAPSILIYGSRDPFVRSRDVELLAARLPESRVAAIDGVGHWPALEAPDELRAELTRFFDG